jgi:ABC-type multidrug transport system ATPase subunit
MLGENGTGKTTFIKMLAGKDPEKINEVFKKILII